MRDKRYINEIQDYALATLGLTIMSVAFCCLGFIYLHKVSPLWEVSVGLGIPFCIITVVMHFMMSIKIMVKHFRNDQITDMQLLYGLLSLFGLSWITGFIFTIKANNYLKKAPELSPAPFGIPEDAPKSILTVDYLEKDYHKKSKRKS